MADAGRTETAPGLDFGPNQWMVEEMLHRYRTAPDSVDPAWREFFAGVAPAAPDLDGPAIRDAEVAAPAVAPPETAAPPPPDRPAPAAGKPGDDREEAGVEKLVGIPGRIAEAMDASLEVPTATSVRNMPAKLLEVNRRILNNQLQRRIKGGKVSFTHLIGWAVIRSLREMPEMNVSYQETEGAPGRAVHKQVNLGLAMDMEGRDGGRILVVPNIKGVQDMEFEDYWQAYQSLVRRVQSGKATPDDFAGTTVTLTNPGTVGTVHSVPRLMKGQGLIVGVGAIEHPPEYQGADQGTIARLGIGKVISISSTYDHRVIQGAQSGRFLSLVNEYLRGGRNFYGGIFHSTRMPYTPAQWAVDDNPPFGTPAWAEKQAQVFSLINAYRVRGHLIAQLDPLMQEPPSMPAELDPLTYGLTIWDLDREFATNGVGGESILTLGELLGRLRDAYCRTIGIEYMHIQDQDEKTWLQHRLERRIPPPSSEEKIEILTRLNQAEAFETFLHTKYVGQKRFGLEGVESLIPLLTSLLDQAAGDDILEVIIGMSHRGRLNVLANVAGKSHSRIFREFEDEDPETIQGSGDVRHHLGAVGLYRAGDGNEVTVQLIPNPSHLEAVDPVLEGMARAKQERLGKLGYTQILPVLMHGDAAFAGQGVVLETLNLSQLDGYRTGGTIHIIINNQVGFTTSTVDARSSHYATDAAKAVGAPILHVNADDPEAVVRATRLAFTYRQIFAKDVIIDMIGYRRRGHNEGDEPSFTQPLMYRRIDERPSVRELYLSRLVNTGELTEEDANRIAADFHNLLQAEFEKDAAAEQDRPRRFMAASRLRAEFEQDAAAEQTALEEAEQEISDPPTAVHLELLSELNEYVNTPPTGFTVHPKLGRVLTNRLKLFEQGSADWAMAEYFAFGSLAEEGTWVRVAGEDSARGTFSHRHASLVDFETGEEWMALAQRTFETARVRFVDSLLSEFAAMGFEYGYSLERPDSLVAWEAQFGDFANGAQVVFDTFLSAAEDKWGLASGLVVLLPHGYEGQGPEHSSARIERYLQMGAEDNMHILYPSQASQMFHLLRRQVLARPSRPAIVFSPKSLLRTQASFSPLADFTHGGLQRVIPDPEPPAPIRVMVFCSGKVFYEASRLREERGVSGMALHRIEELYPLDESHLRDLLNSSPGARVAWLQEEPANMGPAFYMQPRLSRLAGRETTVVCRPESASPAAGSHRRHNQEQARLMDELFSL